MSFPTTEVINNWFQDAHTSAVKAVGGANFLGDGIPWLSVMWLCGLSQFNVLAQDSQTIISYRSVP